MIRNLGQPQRPVGVLFLVGARQECPCCDVMVFGFCGLVSVGVFEFHSVFGFCRVFFFFFFPVLVSFLYISCMFGGAFMLFIYFSTYLSKKKKKNILTLKNSSNIMFVIAFSSMILFHNNHGQISLRS
jgi:hypothetical protein